MNHLTQLQILNRKKGPARALIFWPLVLYYLVQFLPSYNRVNHNEWSYFHTQDANFIRHTVSNDQNEQRCIHQNMKNLEGATSSSLDSCPPSDQNSQSLHNKESSTLLSPNAYSLLTILDSLHRGFQSYEGTIFGGKVILAEAALYDADVNKEIINLNSTNFIPKIIQSKIPFPHIKLIEYYVTHSKFCTNFKATYQRLAKEIYPWRNVIRPSAIDLEDPMNSLIAESWQLKIVPTLRLHPPPAPSLADKFDSLINNLKNNSPGDIQRSFCHEYNQTNLMVDTLNAVSYLDKVETFKSDIKDYVERYVRNPNNYIPSSWPNLKPVTEVSLNELCNNHPRQDLFLLIEVPGKISPIDRDRSSSSDPSSALGVMLELSSSPALRAIRYVRANDNKALIEDVITNYRKQMSDSKQNNLIIDQLNLLNNSISDQALSDGQETSVILVHTDAHMTTRKKGIGSSTFPIMTLVTSDDLMRMEQSVLSDKQHVENSNIRARRNINRASRIGRSPSDSDDVAKLDMSSGSRADLLALYIDSSYTPTKEDKEFVNAIRAFDQGDFIVDQSVDLNKKSDIKQDPSPTTVSSRLQLQNTTTFEPREQTAETQDSGLIDKLGSIVTTTTSTTTPKDESSTSIKSEYVGDYGDKLKAIRYMLFTEIPRINVNDKSRAEQQQILTTVSDLVSVIRAYFPLPDSSSVHFIDGLHSYLFMTQKRAAQSSNKGIIFDPIALKQEMKRLEEEDKRLPMIKEWKTCEYSMYPCALWRLFHTLTSFEYKKLNQLRQISQSPGAKIPRQPKHRAPYPILPDPSVEAMTTKPGDLIMDQSPVEHLVSPPSANAPLSLTIASASPSQLSNDTNTSNVGSKKPETESDLPTPVILVMRDYISNFYSCLECRENFRSESNELSRDRFRREPAEFSVMWLWEMHNRVNKRLSVDQKTNPEDHRKVWFPTYEQCPSCYKRPPSFFREKSVDPDTMFKESIEWNRPEVLSFLISEYTKQPMDSYANIFGYQVPLNLGYGIVIFLCLLLMIIISRCMSSYIERQRRHKATLLNGNGAHYSLQLPS